MEEKKDLLSSQIAEQHINSENSWGRISGTTHSFHQINMYQTCFVPATVSSSRSIAENKIDENLKKKKKLMKICAFVALMSLWSAAEQ